MLRCLRLVTLFALVSLLTLSACQRASNESPRTTDAVRSTSRLEPETTPTEDPAPMNETTPTSKPAETSPVEPDHYVFVGAPKYFSKLDCEIFDTPEAPHRRPPRGDLHDATDYPERFLTSIEVLDVVQGTGPIHAFDSLGDEESKSQWYSSVAFALGLDAFREGSDKGEMGEYDRRWCARINAIMTSPYVVIHAYKVHVDRGNSGPNPFIETWGSLGTDPRKGNRGFETREEALAYAKSLVSK